MGQWLRQAPWEVETGSTAELDGRWDWRVPVSHLAGTTVLRAPAHLGSPLSDLWCQDVSGSAGENNHTAQTQVSETWETPVPYFLPSSPFFCKTSIQQIILHKMLMYRVWPL